MDFQRVRETSVGLVESCRGWERWWCSSLPPGPGRAGQSGEGRVCVGPCDPHAPPRPPDGREPPTQENGADRIPNKPEFRGQHQQESCVWMSWFDHTARTDGPRHTQHSQAITGSSGYPLSDDKETHWPRTGQHAWRITSVGWKRKLPSVRKFVPRLLPEKERLPTSCRSRRWGNLEEVCRLQEPSSPGCPSGLPALRNL